MSYGVSTNEIRDLSKPFSSEEIKSFGSALVFAPHPDDESLACGGLIALLRSINVPVNVIFVSDGSMSHPGSAKFPADKLSTLRASEALTALSFLDVSSEHVFFMGLKDGCLPCADDPGFKEAVSMIVNYLLDIVPHTIVLPWRRDTHHDHQSCWQMVTRAIFESGIKALTLEYPLWLWERGDKENLPQKDEVDFRSVNISEWLRVKELAINAHQSQVTHLIDDDPNGFWLSPEVIKHFLITEEVYLQDRIPT